MINGRKNYMPVSGLIQMLAGMPSDNVERIELITTPPANFDAEGNAGYINIVLKRNLQFGTNGSYSLTAGYSNGLVPSASGNFNQRNAKWNFYGNYSFNRIGTGQVLNLYHATTSQGKFIENFSSSDRKPVETISDLKIGLDYDIKKDLIIGTLVTFYNRRWDMSAYNNSSILSNGEREDKNEGRP